MERTSDEDEGHPKVEIMKKVKVNRKEHRGRKIYCILFTNYFLKIISLVIKIHDMNLMNLFRSIYLVEIPISTFSISNLGKFLYLSLLNYVFTPV